ncbi:MAG: hypothetical protein ACRDRL_02795, partial [Sciscionella sp.]
AAAGQRRPLTNGLQGKRRTSSYRGRQDAVSLDPGGQEHPPAQPGDVDQPIKGDILGQGANQYFVGSVSPCGHSTSSHSAGRGSVSLIAMPHGTKPVG